jgi:hypothetical protein
MAGCWPVSVDLEWDAQDSRAKNFRLEIAFPPGVVMLHQSVRELVTFKTW